MQCLLTKGYGLCYVFPEVYSSNRRRYIPSKKKKYIVILIINWGAGEFGRVCSNLTSFCPAFVLKIVTYSFFEV